MRISDWSSDVCSSDLLDLAVDGRCQRDRRHRVGNIFGRDGLDESMGKTNFVAHGRTERNRPQEFHKLGRPHDGKGGRTGRSEEHTSELPSLMRTSYAVFCLKKKTHRKIKRLNSLQLLNSYTVCTVCQNNEIH